MAESFRTVASNFDLFERQSPKISARDWRIHGLLFLLTIATTTLAGIMQGAPDIPAPEPPLATPIDYLLYVPLTYYYLLKYALSHPALFGDGV